MNTVWILKSSSFIIELNVSHDLNAEYDNALLMGNETWSNGGFSNQCLYNV